MIFLADTKCCAQTAATVSVRDGWQKMDAVTNKNIVELDDDIASRWGPRVVDLVKSIREAITLVAASKLICRLPNKQRESVQGHVLAFGCWQVLRYSSLRFWLEQ
jgi:hypothetical protein